MPKLQRKLHVHWRKAAAVFSGIKDKLRNLLAIASAFPLENKRESWRATGTQARGTDYLEPDT